MTPDRLKEEVVAAAVRWELSRGPGSGRRLLPEEQRLAEAVRALNEASE